MTHDAHGGREFDIEVWFLAYDPEAGGGGQLILYNGQGCNSKDIWNLRLELGRKLRQMLRTRLGRRRIGRWLNRGLRPSLKCLLNCTQGVGEESTWEGVRGRLEGDPAFEAVTQEYERVRIFKEFIKASRENKLFPDTKTNSF